MITSILSPTSSSISSVNAKLLLRGVHLELSEATKASIASKAERLFRHEPEILRLRIDVERGHGGASWLYTAKGLVEIHGPDLQVSVTTEDAFKSISLLMDKLERMLRKRTTALVAHRQVDDIRAYTAGSNCDETRPSPSHFFPTVHSADGHLSGTSGAVS